MERNAPDHEILALGVIHLAGEVTGMGGVFHQFLVRGE